MTDKSRRIVVFAPHFAEYATRLAAALCESAEVLLIREAKNLASECAGLSIGLATPRLRCVTYTADYALRRVSPRGYFETRRIRKAIEAFKPDLIHIQEQGDRFTASVAEDWAPRVPIVLTVHDPVPHSGNDKLVAERFAAGLVRLRAAASAYHVHGAHCEALLRPTLGTPKPIAATPHGVILVPPDGQSATGGDRYLFFGRMESYKGLDTLLDAIDLLPRSAFRFVLAGRGPELERYRDRIAARSDIEVVDEFLPPLDAIRQFQRARAILVPYRDATQSGVVSAAYANGKPVIAARVGGLVDAIEDGKSGLMIPSNDPSSLAAAIRAMAADATREHLAAGAQAAADGRFAWSTIAARLHRLYADVLAERRSSSGLERGRSA